MKYFNSTLTITLLTLTSLSAQIDSSVINYITITGQYIDGEGVELRWFPNNRSVMALGIEHGYRIERADVPTSPSNGLQFITVKTVQPYNSSQWNTAVAEKNTAGVTNNLPEMAGDFAKTVQQRENPSIAILPDANDLKVLKHEENNEHGSLMLTAVQDKDVAIGLGIGVTDDTALPGKKYIYRAIIDLPLPTSPVGGIKKISGSKKLGKVIAKPKSSKANIQNMTIESMEMIIHTVAAPKLTNNTVKVKAGDGALTISWEEQPGLFGYYIERSNSKQGGYQPLNQAPLIQVRGANYHGKKMGSYHDTELSNERTYYYRVSANNLFGEKIEVANVQGKPQDLTPPKPPHLDQPIHKDDEVILTWQFTNNPPSDLSGFKVYRSDKADGQYTLLTNNQLPAQTRNYSDNGYNSKGANYYKVEAFDNKGNMNTSLPAYAVIVDDTPPIKPAGIQASISDNGEVQIVIPAQKDDDVIGYKIFKANQADHEFIVAAEYFPNAVDPVAAIKWQEDLQKREMNDLTHANLYHDKENPTNKGRANKIEEKYVFTESIPLNNLTPSIFYKVKAYDRNHNQSEFSDVIELVKKDVVAPPRSVFKSVKTSLNKVDITFAKAKAKDFNRVELSRKSLDGRRWQVIHTLKGDLNKEDIVRYRDQKVEPGREYIYRLQTIDNNGLKSPFSFSSTVKTINRVPVPNIQKVSAKRANGKVSVSWTYELSDEFFFIVYRTFEDGTLRQIGRSETNSFIDNRPPSGQVSYAVKPMRKDGNRGKMSEMVVVR